MQKNYGNVIILLTGCINPNGMGYTSIQNPIIRQKEYVKSINYYLKYSNLNILFVENSGIDISNLFIDEIRKGRLEILCFNGNNYDKNLGKGYGEALIIEHAVKYSRLLIDSDFIFKITGRYILRNLNSFAKQYREAEQLDIMVDLLENLHLSDSRFWGCNLNFLKECFLKYKDSINDSKHFYFEHALCYATHEAIIRNYKFQFLKYEPRIAGISGTNNYRYKDDWAHWYLRNIKHILRYKFMNRFKGSKFF